MLEFELAIRTNRCCLLPWILKVRLDFGDLVCGPLDSHSFIASLLCLMNDFLLDTILERASHLFQKALSVKSMVLTLFLVILLIFDEWLWVLIDEMIQGARTVHVTVLL